MLGALVGGILLNLMPCVFPILALKALHLARCGRRRARRGATPWPMRRARSSAPGALGALLLAIRAGGQRGGLGVPAAGPADDHRPAAAGVGNHPQPPAPFRAAGAGGRAQPERQLRRPERWQHSSRRPAPGRSSARRWARRCCCRLWFGRRVRGAGAGPRRFPSWPIAFIPPLRSDLPQPGPWMARLQRFLAIPMAATAVGCLWLL